MAEKRNHLTALNSEDFEHELLVARKVWGDPQFEMVSETLKTFLKQTGFRVSAGEVLLLDTGLYVSSAGLLRLARQKRCAGIHTEILDTVSDALNGRWVVRACVYKTSRSTTCFVGLGDAHPGNVGAKFHGAELRVAETRAVNRALRKAYGVALCSIEELGASCQSDLEHCGPVSRDAEIAKSRILSDTAVSEQSSLQPSAVDRLKLVIREHQLPPAQVRQYGCQYLGVQEMREATAVQINSLAGHLEQFAIASPSWLRSELDRAQAPLALAASSSAMGKESLA
jgi:hypothetical protein